MLSLAEDAQFNTHTVPSLSTKHLLKKFSGNVGQLNILKIYTNKSRMMDRAVATRLDWQTLILYTTTSEGANSL